MHNKHIGGEKSLSMCIFDWEKKNLSPFLARNYHKNEGVVISLITILIIADGAG
jgi:hypothetical protein